MHILFILFRFSSSLFQPIYGVYKMKIPFKDKILLYLHSGGQKGQVHVEINKTSEDHCLKLFSDYIIRDIRNHHKTSGHN